MFKQNINQNQKKNIIPLQRPPAPVPKPPAPLPKPPAPVQRPPAPVPKPPAPVPKPPAPLPKPLTPPIKSLPPPPSPKPMAPPAKPTQIAPPPKPMITNITSKPIIMPITGSPVSSTNKSVINNSIKNNNPSIKSTFIDKSKPIQLSETQNILLKEIRKLQDVVNVNIKNISETTNETNVILEEIKQLETEVNNNLNISDNLPRADKISDRLEKLEKSVKNRVKSKTIIELLTNRIHFILGNLHKKVIEIKKADKGILDLLPNVFVDIISFLINFIFLIIPILLIGFLIIYTIFSESEYASAIREWFKNLFNFTKQEVNE
jgi:hypothetical protein